MKNNMTPEEIMKEDKLVRDQKWNNLLSQFKEITPVSFPEEILVMLKTTFDAGWSGGSIQTLRHFV